MAEDLQAAAEGYWKQGCNIVLLKDKKPLREWAKWITERQTSEEFENLPWATANQFACVCGTRLENGFYLAVIDYDTKNLPAETITKGKEALKNFPITQTELTPSGGKHFVYYCYAKPETVSAFHNDCALELCGSGKLCIMAPSVGYQKLNDNTPSDVQDLEAVLLEAMFKAGIKPREDKKEAWFDREDLAGKAYKGQNPPCIASLSKGTSEGLRNEYGIRLASFLLNFKGYQPQTVQKMLKDWNRLNQSALEQTELDRLVRSAAQGNYVYGCHDPILEQLCVRSDCPLAPKTRTLTEEDKKAGEAVLATTDLSSIVLEYGKRRLIGENNILIINFVEIVSGQTPYPISGIISGYSGSGKNESIRAVKPLIPEEWLFEFSTSTPEAIKYLPEDFAGTLIIYEASGMQSKTATLGLRAVGEGESIETIYPMRDEATGKMTLGRAKTNAKNFITTESNIDIEPDLYRRVFKHSMNPSYVLSMRVCAKAIREASMPESLKQLLHKSNEPSVSLTDFQNALRVQNWKAEAIVFTPKELLALLDVAHTKEQQVALRTQFNKILSFIKVLALLNQKNRVRVRVQGKDYVIASPEDYQTGLAVLSETILETVSRIEKRQQDVLELFDTIQTLDKNKVVEKLRVSAVTAARALKTLANSGYLKENRNVKPYTYERTENTLDKPNSLVFMQNTSQYKPFYEKELESFLTRLSSLVTSEGLESKVEITSSEPLEDLRHTDKTSDKMRTEPESSLSERTDINPLVFSPKTSETRG